MELMSKLTLEIFTKLEQKWLSHCEHTKKIRILSIDGGGTTGIVAGAALVHLEEQIRLQTGDPHAQIADFFDLIAGTGIGAILATMISADDGSGRPIFTAREAVNTIAEKHSDLFKLKFGGLFSQSRRYSGTKMDKMLKDLFRSEDGKALTLKDTLKPLLVPCFDLKSSAPFVFSRADASESPSFNFELWKVCHATSATPYFFKPFNLSSVDGKTSCSALDGGLVMNNPTAAAVTHVLHNKRDFPSVNSVEDLLVLSLGNGSQSKRKILRQNRQSSTSSVIDIVFDGVSETIDQMLGNAFRWNCTDYIRIQAYGLGVEETVGLRTKEDEAEVLKERGVVESLPFGGKRLLTETNGKRLENLVQRLVAWGKTSLSSSSCKESAVSPFADVRQ